MIPFTFRELKNAWKCSRLASQVAARTDAHRLLMFYAIECGLKAVHLRRTNRDVIDEEVARLHMHDLNGLLSTVKASKDFFLPTNVTLQPIRINGSQVPRNCTVGSLNQVWRYGGALGEAKNIELQNLFDKIDVWIAKEIQ